VTSNYKSVRAVVFDAVGTLIYPDPPAAVAYHQLGRAFGSQLTQDTVSQNFRLVLKQHAYEPRTNENIERERWRRIVANVFTDLDDTETLFHQLWEHFANAMSWAVYDDVLGVFAQLESRGVAIAIGSNFDDRLIAIAERLPPLRFARQIFVSSKLECTKPSVDFFRSIEGTLRLSPEQLLMVGDDLQNDFGGARSAGWHSLWLDRASSTNAVDCIRTLGDIIPRFA